MSVIGDASAGASSSLQGKITTELALAGTITAAKALRGNVSTDVEHKNYGGPYSVTPDVVEQTLGTASKVMTEDVSVKAIPYYAVSNDFGGETIIIGGNN